MNQFILLVIILTCKLSSSQDIEIDHGDSFKTKIYYWYEGTLNVRTFQESKGVYFTENPKTGVKVSYYLPVETTKDDSTLELVKQTSADGKKISFGYVTAKRQTREEVFRINDSGKIRVTGSFSYFDPNGNNYLQGYEADENGYRTKVSFGTKIMYVPSQAPKSAVPEPAQYPGAKKIDGMLLCSLGGSGCYK